MPAYRARNGVLVPVLPKLQACSLQSCCWQFLYDARNLVAAQSGAMQELLLKEQEENSLLRDITGVQVIYV